MSTVSFENCTVEHEREEALLVYIPEISDEPQWIPKANIAKDESEVLKNGDKGTLAIAEWFAIEKEWV
jgi:hypothetical protein